jgi:membrane-bound serine protease (ClpP class)
MNLLLDPNLMFVMLVAGFVMAILSVFVPGTGLLEIGALFTLFIAGYGMLNLPINLWALAIILVGVVPFLFALRRWRHWSLMLVSLAALVVGSVFMFRAEGQISAVNPILAIIILGGVVPFLWFIGRKSLDAMQLKPSHNLESLLDQVGEARSDIRGEGTVYVGGEEWAARSQSYIQTGQKVRVIRREGLYLIVEPEHGQ